LSKKCIIDYKFLEPRLKSSVIQKIVLGDSHLMPKCNWNVKRNKVAEVQGHSVGFNTFFFLMSLSEATKPRYSIGLTELVILMF
jgi:hypothetical protein